MPVLLKTRFISHKMFHCHLRKLFHNKLAMRLHRAAEKIRFSHCFLTVFVFPLLVKVFFFFLNLTKCFYLFRHVDWKLIPGCCYFNDVLFNDLFMTFLTATYKYRMFILNRREPLPISLAKVHMYTHDLRTQAELVSWASSVHGALALSETRHVVAAHLAKNQKILLLPKEHSQNFQKHQGFYKFQAFSILDNGICHEVFNDRGNAVHLSFLIRFCTRFYANWSLQGLVPCHLRSYATISAQKI